VLLAIAAMIKIDSPGPVFFFQERRGFNNRRILVAKFRTMQHHSADPLAAQQTSRRDARITRVGRFLRRHSLDELPQLFNVLKGDMSLVGPRPHALGTTVEGHMLEDAVETYLARLRVKPGITGWAQVNGWRGELDVIEKAYRRVEHDLEYIRKWSLWMDMKILALTAWKLLRDENAY
jgi:lipopolysaccharide/colanic/teichoic acid biosynthesis glycosyltransferase